MSVTVRPCAEHDLGAVRDIFIASYRDEYPYRHFLDTEWLKRSIYSEGVLMFVAEETDTQRVLGTASIVLDVGADSDLMGEFGRLAVHPDARGQGVGAALMEARLTAASERLHVALVEGRTAHAFSQRIAFGHGFAPVGFLPQKHLLRVPESVVLGVRYFGEALQMRRNNPRVVPEVKPLAHWALTACGLEDDAVVDEVALPYPVREGFGVEEFTGDHFSPLLRIERGRTRQREVFGARTLAQGLFKLTHDRARYAVAKRALGGDVAGAIGYLHDAVERSVKITELVFSDEGVVRQLLAWVIDRAGQWNVRYVEVDVHGSAPRMQRTMLELGFVPCAYVPAMVFVNVERVDGVRLVHWRPTAEDTRVARCPDSAPVVELVTSAFAKEQLLPGLGDAVRRLSPFKGFSSDQERRLLSACSLRRFDAGATLFRRGEEPDGFFVVLEGAVVVEGELGELARLGPGEFVGEHSALSGERRGVTVSAAEPLLAAHLGTNALTELSRLRPDVAAMLYRNLALGLGRKLRTMGRVAIETAE